MRQAEKCPRLHCDIAKIDEAECFPDHIEQVAMLTGGCILPFARRAFGRILESDEHRPAGRVAGITNLPIVPLAMTGREIMAANRLGLSAKAMRKIGSIMANHYAASRSAMRVRA